MAQSIGRNAYYFEDTTSNLTFKQILTPPYQKKFLPTLLDAPNFKITRHALWVKAIIKNNSPNTLYLNIDNPILDTVTFYELNAAGTYTSIEAGTHILPSNRLLFTPTFLFRLNLRRGDSAIYYIRAAANSPMQVPLFTNTVEGFFMQMTVEGLLHGLYYGIISIMILYNLFLFFAIKDKVYLYYIAYAFCIGLFNACVYGHLIYFNDGIFQNWMSRRIVTLASIVLMAMVIFSMTFLDTKKNAPRFHKYLTLITALLIIPISIELSGDVWTSDNVVNIFSIVIPFSLLTIGIHLYKRGFKPAKYYILAWIPFLISIIIFTLAMQNFIQSTQFTKNSMEIGSALEVLLISLALADRINIYKIERAKAQDQLLLASRENELLILDQNLLLEQKVEERTQELVNEKRKSDDLLLNILPEEIAVELKENGHTRAKQYDNVSVLFADFVGFTKIAAQIHPQQLVNELDSCFKAFDAIMDKYHIEKIKTVGDAYLAVCGLPVHNDQHAENILVAAIDIINFIKERRIILGDRTFEVRIGIHTGSVIAGVVGIKKFAYDIWGDTVNTAARMEQNSSPGRINVSESTYQLIKDKFSCQYRGEVEAKNKGMLRMYYVEESV
ncbi:MAG: hypothetical protein BGO69_08650 [Bacteroidetes bacterium 46-16]|nr:MAG: hypothetical protein BGO69_08650 [Bacteroidetes bacterium 46-16]